MLAWRHRLLSGHGLDAANQVVLGRGDARRTSQASRRHGHVLQWQDEIDDVDDRRHRDDDADHQGPRNGLRRARRHERLPDRAAERAAEFDTRSPSRTDSTTEPAPIQGGASEPSRDHLQTESSPQRWWNGGRLGRAPSTGRDRELPSHGHHARDPRRCDWHWGRSSRWRSRSWPRFGDVGANSLS